MIEHDVNVPLILQIKQLEEALLDPATKDTPTLFDDLLAEDFEEIDSTGQPCGKTQALEWLHKGEPDIRWLISDFRIRALSKNLVMANYLATKLNSLTNEKKISARSSLWRREQNRWQMIFHQGTNLKNID